MGYEVHITRARNWVDSEDFPITLAEWKAYCSGDADFNLTGTAIAKLPNGKTLSYENDGLAVWTAFSGHDPDDNQAWFDYRGGRIVVKNPSREIIEKMKLVAERLGARVVGDEDESY